MHKIFFSENLLRDLNFKYNIHELEYCAEFDCNIMEVTEEDLEALLTEDYDEN